MQVMIRCKVRRDVVEANLEFLQEVYEEMRSVQPKGCVRDVPARRQGDIRVLRRDGRRP
jgi:hypothetical protein